MIHYLDSKFNIVDKKDAVFVKIISDGETVFAYLPNSDKIDASAPRISLAGLKIGKYDITRKATDE